MTPFPGHKLSHLQVKTAASVQIEHLFLGEAASQGHKGKEERKRLFRKEYTKKIYKSVGRPT